MIVGSWNAFLDRNLVPNLCDVLVILSMIPIWHSTL